jgi:hypothetical protein
VPKEHISVREKRDDYLSESDQKYQVYGIAPLFAEVYNLEGALREGLTVGA